MGHFPKHQHITIRPKTNPHFVTGQKPVEEKENFPTCKICKEEFLHEDTLKIHNKLRPNCLEPKNPPKPSRKRQSLERIGLSVTKEKVKARKHKRSSDEDSDESSESDSGMFYNYLDLKADSQICDYSTQHAKAGPEQKVKDQKNFKYENFKDNIVQIFKNSVSLIFKLLFRSCLSML